MTEVVLDASVLVKWFKTSGETHVLEAQRLRERYRRGELTVVAPPLLFLEILNAAARRWGWGAAELAVLARELGALGFSLHQPALEGIARWCARGLTAYDACYLALASERRTVVVTTDSLMLSVGGANVRSIEGAAGG